jgi:hypothetical protein
MPPGAPDRRRCLLGLVALATMPIALLTSPEARADSRSAHQFIEIAAPAALVWSRLGEFDDFQRWNPSVKAMRILRGHGSEVGSIRQLQLRNGMRMQHELTRSDPDLMRKEWRLAGWSEIPLDEYRASISVIEMEPSLTMVVWQSRFTVREKSASDLDAVEALLEGLYRSGLARLKFLCENPDAE